MTFFASQAFKNRGTLLPGSLTAGRNCPGRKPDSLPTIMAFRGDLFNFGGVLIFFRTGDCERAKNTKKYRTKQLDQHTSHSLPKPKKTNNKTMGEMV